MISIQSPDGYKKEFYNKLKSGEWSYQDGIVLDENTPDLNRNEAVKSFKIFCKIHLKIEKETQHVPDKFNLSSWNEVNQNPDDFKLIRRVKFSEDPSNYPLPLEQLVGDEITIVFLDFETTGLSHQVDKVIELGLVKVKYSPTKKCMTEIRLVRSVYNDPGMEIAPEITEITGISDTDVKGHKINIEELKQWLEGEGDEPYIIAHNSKFDRPFFTQLIGQDDYKWGCSASQIDWKSFKEYRIESAKLEYILLKLGYFYEGHRASIDCLAMVQMFFVLPQALDQLLSNIDQKSIIIEATKAPFDLKDKLKEAGYRWNGDKKVWWIEVSELELDQYLNELDHFSSSYSSSKANKIELTARERFKLTF